MNALLLQLLACHSLINGLILIRNLLSLSPLQPTELSTPSVVLMALPSDPQLGKTRVSAKEALKMVFPK